MESRLGFLLLLCLTGVTDAAKRARITAPLRLKPGETPIQEPGWKHCLTDMKASGSWKQLRSPGYPKLPGNQMQCSWIIEAPIRWRVAVAFKDLNMAYPAGDGIYKSCRSAYVNLVDVSAQKSQGKFCGTKGPGDYVSMGTKLRIDLQTDKSTTVYRGFIITYRAVRVQPGFRAVRRFSSPSDSAPGKINLNDFKSTQQRLINSAGKPMGSKGYGPGPKRPVYASDIRTVPQQSLTTTMPTGGWAGDLPGQLPPVGKTSNKAGVEAAKFKPRGTLRPGNNGNRISATNQRRKNNVQKLNSDNNQKIKATPVPSQGEGWENAHSSSNGDSQPPQYFGEKIQPAYPPVQQNIIEDEPRPPPSNYVVVHEEGLSTTHLIIIVVGLIGCIVLVASIFLIKHCYCDKKRRRERGRQEEEKSEVEEPTYSVDREMALPGMSRASSMHSINSMRSQGGAMSPDNQTAQHPIPRHQSRGAEDRHHHRRTTSRHQALVAKQEAIYRNHHAVMTSQRHHQGMRRHPSQQRRSHKGVHNRPLPPLPHQKEAKKSTDIDEDYCSGSDEDPDVTPMRRELSPWEIEQQKKNRLRNIHS